MNCFQISNFVLWQTASSFFDLTALLLWIAFKLVILSYGKQLSSFIMYLVIVVNCFQISNFVLWQTARIFFCSRDCKLWIAFKLVILSYGKQHCENSIEAVFVVNCFQISNFVLWQTACNDIIPITYPLWIAFKLVILSYGKQRKFA